MKNKQHNHLTEVNKVLTDRVIFLLAVLAITLTLTSPIL